MAGETVITVVGNLVDDPELRFTPSGAAVANFRIASTPRTFDRQTNEWKDGEALFLHLLGVAAGGRERRRVAAARACASSSRAGSSALLRDPRGREAHRLRARGRRGRPALKYATAKVTRTTRGWRRRWRRLRRRRPAAASGGGQRRPAAAPGDDPWATPAPGRPGRPAGRRPGGPRPTTRGAPRRRGSDEPPF